ncbi:hypothetical protein QWY74_07365 [Halomonas almeriensis]|nr:hypothetical protein [Halomonas almeriensis]MDN3553280.1 hypothetical protein [Halomonas almeriensis]
MVRAQGLARAQRHLPGLGEQRPVDTAFLEVTQADTASGNILIGITKQSRDIVAGGHIGGVDDQALNERRTARGADEGVDIAALQPVGAAIELALDSAVVVLGTPDARHQVDARVLGRRFATDMLNPIGIGPYLVILLTLHVIVLYPGLYQLLEVGSEFTRGTGMLAIAVQQVMKVGTHGDTLGSRANGWGKPTKAKLYQHWPL